MLPMFLFATTFFPLSVYPGPAAGGRGVAALPGIELMRGLTTGVLGAGMLVAVAYLLALGGVSLWLADRRLARLLLT